MDRFIERRRWSPRRIACVIGAGCVVLLALYGFLFGNRGSRVNVETDHLTISTVLSGPFMEFSPVTGNVVPLAIHYLDAIEGGVVDTVYVEVGMFLNEGDRLLKLSNTTLVMDIMYREAELFQQSNNLRNTRLSMEQHNLEMQRQILDITHGVQKQTRLVENNTRLVEKQLIPVQEYRESKEELDYLVRKLDLTRKTLRQDSLFRIAQIEQLEASLSRIQANLDIVKGNMENLVISSPASGQLTSLNAEIGQSVMRGERLGQIDVLGGFCVRAEIDEHYISRVRPGLAGTTAVSDRSYPLRVLKVYPEVVNGRFAVDMEFSEAQPEGIRRGQSLRIDLGLGEASEVVLVPTGGFYYDTGGRWIYVVDGKRKRATRRNIHIGRENQMYYEVLDGIEPGELVITSSYDEFGDAHVLNLK
jgi:HlyD family secretion protein